MLSFFKKLLNNKVMNNRNKINDLFSIEDINNIIKIQCLYRIKVAKKEFIKKWIKKYEQSETEPMNYDEPIFFIGEIILVNNRYRKKIKSINDINKYVVTIDNIKYSYDNIKKSYFDEDFMKISCKKPYYLKNIKRTAFYGIKVYHNNYYININIGKQYWFGPFKIIDYALLYYDWIKFKWLLESGQWFKNNKKQYSNWGFVLNKIENNNASQKTKEMFYEFSQYFKKYLDMSKPEPKKVPQKRVKKSKRETITNCKKRKKISNNKKKDIIHNSTICYIKYVPKRTREKQLSLSKHSELLQIQNNKCALCYENIYVDQWNWEVDHCIPWCLNGGHCMNNLQAVHTKCHKIKTRHIDNKFKEFINNSIEYKDAKILCKASFDDYMNKLSIKKKIFAQSETLSPELILQ